MQTADTLGRGGVQVGLEPGWWGLVDPEWGADGIVYGAVSVRRGVTDRLDVGGRIGSGGLEVLFKHQFTDPRNGGPVVSIAPSVGSLAVPDGTLAWILHAQVPLLLGFPTASGGQFVLAPKIHEFFIRDPSFPWFDTVSMTSLGASVGYAARLGPRFAVLPEVSFVFPVIGAGSGGLFHAGSGAAEFYYPFVEGGIVQVNLALLFGGERRE